MPEMRYARSKGQEANTNLDLRAGGERAERRVGSSTSLIHRSLWCIDSLPAVNRYTGGRTLSAKRGTAAGACRCRRADGRPVRAWVRGPDVRGPRRRGGASQVGAGTDPSSQLSGHLRAPCTPPQPQPPVLPLQTRSPGCPGRATRDLTRA